MSGNIITNDYYDNETYTMLLNRLTDDDKEYMKNNTDETTEIFMVRRWSTIINALPIHYYNQYYSQTTPETRNAWFQKYLDYPTKNILEMPDTL